MNTDIITASYNDTISVIFTQDAFINATAIAKQFGKKTEGYLRTNETKEYISALQKWLFPADNSNALKSVIEQNQLVIVKGGSSENGGGTWLHPKLAVNFARWLSADFAVWCDMQIESILHKVQYGLKDHPINTPVYLTPNMVQHIKEEIAVKTTTQGISYQTCYDWIHRKYHANSITTVKIVHYPAICNDLHVEPREEMPQYIMVDSQDLGTWQLAEDELRSLKADPTPLLICNETELWTKVTNDDVIIPFVEFEKMTNFIESHQQAKDSIADCIKNAFDQLDTDSENILVGRQRWNELNFIVKKVMSNPQALAIL
jgi:hypothetical protein